MPSAEIIAIGTELLLGEIPDTNTQFIARAFRDQGINVFRTTIVGDNIDRIVAAVREAMKRSEIIITTGGLGPTVDDPTRSALAQVSKSDLVFNPAIWESISLRFGKTGRIPGENQKRQAYFPKNALIIENPVGTAPAFIISTKTNVIASLPGVPSEMKILLINAILPFLQDHYKIQETLVVQVLHTSGAGEGWIDEKIGDLEILTNPTVGLAAHSGIVDIRIAAKARNNGEANTKISEVENEIRNRLGDYIFGSNADTLERIALEVVTSYEWSVYCIESGTSGLLNQRLLNLGSTSYLGGKQIFLKEESLLNLAEEIKTSKKADVILGLSVKKEVNSSQIDFVIITPMRNYDHQVIYTGSSQNAPELGVNLILDFVRRKVSI
jgi:nicotinamide-nucleotide amidase